jgi:hypothetical protein
MKGSQFHAVAADHSFGTEVPGPLGILFRQESTLVLFARNEHSMKIKEQSTAPIAE